MTRAQRRADHAKHRRSQTYRERLQREHARAQRHLQALEHALVEVGVAEPVVEEVQGRLQAVRKLLGKIFGLMFPIVLGCRTHHALTRVRNWDQNRPAQILGGLPQQTWLRPWQPREQDLLATRWRQVEDKSPATRSRWPWTWVGDDSVCKKAGPQLGLVGAWYRGQEQRVRLGSDGLRLIVVIGEGKLVLPVDFTVRRPDPVGPGRPCRDQLTWRQVLWVGPGPRGHGWGWCCQRPWSSPIAGSATRRGWRTWRALSAGRRSWRAHAPTSSGCPTGAG